MISNKEQLVEKLTGIFKDTDLALYPYIDSIVTEAKKRAKRNPHKERKQKLVAYFDIQMEILESRGCPKVIIKKFQEKKDDIVLTMAGIWREKYRKETIESLKDNGIYLGIPVVPANLFSNEYSGLMNMVRNGDKAGYTIMNSDEVNNVMDIPEEPYFIIDVEDGKKYLGKYPEDVEGVIKEDGRFCLTAEEGIFLCILTETLSDHCVDCAGSIFSRSDRVPSVCLRGKVPNLDYWRCYDGPRDKWGSASCYGRWA